MLIPFNKPYLTGQEIEYIKDCIASGYIAANSTYTHKVQAFIENTYGSKSVFLTTSGTDALEMAFLLLDLAPGDEVIMPSYTFVSTANAVLLRGAKPIFADIDGSLNINPQEIKPLINEQTRAILPVHYAGISCDMDSIMALASQYNLAVVEDAAQGVNAKYKDKYLGTMGKFGCYSFHGTKNISSGEGGALLINQDDDEIINRAHYIWEKGTNRKQFNLGEVDKYTWVDIGSSFAPAELLAAYLYAQFEQADFITKSRREIFHNYYQHLQTYADRGLIKLPVITEKVESNYHIFYIIFNHITHRDLVLKYLQEHNIGATFHFIPLHLSPMGNLLGYEPGQFPLTEKMASSILRLPIYPNLQADEQAYILEHLDIILTRLL